MSGGYQALREGVAWLDLEGRGCIRMTGDDRARLLHAMCTNHIQQMKPGDSCYAFFLNAQGRILGDANVFCLEDSFLLDTEPALHDVLYGHLDRYIIADDVTLTDERPGWTAIGVEGSAASGLLSKVTADVRGPFSYTGAPGERLLIPREQRPKLVALLESLGAVAASMNDAEVVRLEHSHLRFGADFSDKHLTHETQLLHAIHFSKGCYLGQEIVERVRSRGQVHKLLVPVSIDTATPPPPSTAVMAGDAAAGETMSAAYSPSLQRTVAIAYLRAEHAQPGTALSIGGATATVTAAKGQ